MSVTGRLLRFASTVVICAGLAALVYVGFVVGQAMAATSVTLKPVDTRRPFVAGETLGQIRIGRLE